MTLERNLALPAEVVSRRMATSRPASAVVDIPKKDEPMYSRHSPSNVHILMTSSSDLEFSNR
ncbi:hypothetical protein DPMN_182074 [Dreissena polymorpha]|uniref:Uncharacterized protein n=1 Tax=Dreissena polymorpha TaxID=45954 RepID=A0A9D4DEX4_DREPO|nr:hypothetical protein DPMN_182074 [Dreissena polymorpha]